MKYNELNISAAKSKKRVGRGIAAGRGKTAGRGTKGQNARKSGGVRPGFEGGQNPLMQRLPKLRGFTSKRVAFETVYTGQIQDLKEATIDTSVLVKHGLVSSKHVNVKLIVKGDLTRKVAVHLPAASETAAAMLKKAGGSFVKTERVARPKVKK
jgi:large subunit ribosomal protein L15